MGKKQIFKKKSPSQYLIFESSVAISFAQLSRNWIAMLLRKPEIYL